MRILVLVFLLVFEVYAVDILNTTNRYNFTVFNDSVSGAQIDVFATNGGIVVSENGSIEEISLTTQGSPIGKVITLNNDGDSVLWAGTGARGVYKLVHSTGRVTRTTDFDNISINSIDRDSNALYLGTNSGLFYFDPITMISADNGYRSFGIYQDTVSTVKVYQDTIYLKHNGRNCSKAYRKAFLADDASWVNFVDSLKVVFPDRDIIVGDNIKTGLSEEKWYYEIWDLVSGKDGVYLAANFYSSEFANVADVRMGIFNNINSNEFKKEGIQNLHIDKNYLTIIRPSRGVVQYNTATEIESKRYELGPLPGRDLASAIAVDGTNIAIANTSYFEPSDDRDKINYNGGLSMLNMSSDSSFNLLNDTTGFIYKYENPRKFNLYNNSGVTINEYAEPTHMAKITDSTYLYVLSNKDKSVFLWNTKGTYKNVKDDVVNPINNLNFGETVAFFESFNKKVITGAGTDVAIYIDNVLSKKTMLHSVIDGDFVNDSTVVYLQEDNISFANIKDISNITKSISLSDLHIGEVPTKISVDKEEKTIVIAGLNSISYIKYSDVFSQSDVTQNSPTVYPNPYYRSGENVTILNLLEDSEVIVYTSLGKIVNKFKTPYAQSFYKWDGRTRSGSKVAPGVYYVIIKDNRGTTKFKLLVL